VDVFVSGPALEQFGDVLDPALRGVRPVRVGPDVDTAGVECAWLSADLFYDGNLDAFFDGCRRAAGLRWVHTSSAGTDGAWFDELLDRGVRLTTSHVNDVPIAEYVLAMVLRHFQRHQDWAAAQAERRWAHHDFREIAGTTWVVVGLGAIGARVAERARAFGARVVGVRRSPVAPVPVDALVTPDRLHEVLPSADVVVLARPAAPGAPPVVDGAFLAAMREESLLVNVARGSLVDDGALLAALDRGVPEHAVLDVFDVEPLPPDNPFWSHPRVTVTPHSANGGVGRYRRAAELFAANLTRYRRGEPLPDEVVR
jgi:phosphoglycerate dehydrogenase-like enzyme